MFEVGARSGHATATDIVAFAGIGLGIALQAFAGHPTGDVVARPAAYYQAAPAPPPPGFPTQYAGLRYNLGAAYDLCMVAEADAPLGMGGVLKIKTPSGIRAVYLVETSDPYATAIRIRTSAGTKAIRIKT